MLTVSLLVCAMMALAAANDEVTVPQPTCPVGFKVFNGRCYRFVSKLLPWAEAEKNCQRMEANLVSVHSVEEDWFVNGMIMSEAPHNPTTWIGASNCQQENRWLWSDGKASSFRNLCDRPMRLPANETGCMQTNHRATTCWINRECSLYRASVCAYNPPTGSTCLDGWNNYDGRCYRFVSKLLPWAEAEVNCQRMEPKANLASVHSNYEDQFLQNMIYSHTHDYTPAWIGASNCEQENNFLWSNGKVSPFRNWCDPPMFIPPNNTGCVLMNHKATTCWTKQECSTDRASVCAYNPSTGLDCLDGWNNYNGRCYRFVPETMDWAEAEVNCQKMDANLVSVHSEEEERFLQNMMYSQTLDYIPAWIGSSDCQKVNVWLWSNGKASPFTNMCKGPAHLPSINDRCMVMNQKAETCWTDRECSIYQPSVCASNL